MIKLRPDKLATLLGGCTLLIGCGGSPPTNLDLLILGGILVDGSGQESSHTNIGVQGDRITWIGEDGAQATDTLDATGLVVAPGFIDVHSHTVPALLEPQRRMNEGVLRQGVTTVVGGPDGGFGPEMIRTVIEALGNNGSGTNVATYIGHNAIRENVMGEDQQRAPNPSEFGIMRTQVREGMELGAVGFSTGLMYEPGMFSETSEVVELAREVAPFGGIYDSHVRNPVHAFVESDQEVVSISEGAEISGKIGHLKAVGLHNEGRINDVIDLVEGARSRGVEIVSDQYPYDGAATSSLIGIIVIPSSMTDLEGLRSSGPVDSEAAARFRSMLVDPSRRTQLKEASENGIDGGFAWLKATGYSSMRIVSSTDYPELVGVYLSELPEEGQDPFDAVMDLIAGASASVNITLGAITEEDVRTLMIQPWNMIASDGAYADGSEAGRGHPRGAGTFARFLGHYVREEGVLPLEEAIRKITSLPADFLGLMDRGRIEEGYAADLSIFNAETIIDRSDWDYPQRFAEGIVHVLVNGSPVLRDGSLTGQTPGVFLSPTRSP
ncbi:MAG: amidohydrolase family protein [Gemmatimonadetes bacterium]|nr:amidohydrolase family protein [Gemmatimonadota bacterium]